MQGPARDFESALGVDLSATNITVLVGKSDGTIDAQRKEKTDKSDPEAPGRQIIRLARECMEKAGVRPDGLDGIGVSCVGPYDKERGGILRTPNIDFDFVPVRDPLKEAFKLRYVRGGDCFGACHAEADFGRGKDNDNVFYLTKSTGIGGGAIIDGRALFGRDGDAGHIGHFTIDPSPKARECGCRGPDGKRRRGHWEAYGSGTAVASILQESVMSKAVNLPGTEPYQLDKRDINRIALAASGRLGKRADKIQINDLAAEDLYAAARKEGGYGNLHHLVDAINYLNTLGFAMVTDAYNPGIIVVGGSMMNDEDLILPYVMEHLPEHAILGPPEIAKTQLGPISVALGGIAMLRHYQGE